MTYYKIFCKMHRRTDFYRKRRCYIEIMKAVTDPEFFEKRLKSRKKLQSSLMSLYAPIALLSSHTRNPHLLDSMFLSSIPDSIRNLLTEDDYELMELASMIREQCGIIFPEKSKGRGCTVPYIYDLDTYCEEEENNEYFN